MHNRTKRKIPLMIVGVLLLSILTACGKDPEEKFKKVELTFLGIERDGDYAHAYYEAPEDEAYYEINISAYQYNNWDKKGLPKTLKVIREVEPYTTLVGISTYDAMFLSSLDKKKNKEFKDVDLADLSYTDLDRSMVEVEYWTESED